MNQKGEKISLQSIYLSVYFRHEDGDHMSHIVNTNVKTWGNGKAVRLSRKLLAVAGFSEDERVEIIAEPEQIVIKKQKFPKKPLKEVLENYQSFYEPAEEEEAWLSMKPVGNEKW